MNGCLKENGATEQNHLVREPQLKKAGSTGGGGGGWTLYADPPPSLLGFGPEVPDHGR